MSLRGRAIAVLAAGLCAAFPALGAAPPGWIIGGNAPTDYEFTVDSSTAASGKRSALITAKQDARTNGFGMLMQTIAADDYRGSRLRLSGYLRTQTANRAQMMMRVDGPDGKVLDFDNMDSRPVTGTTGWTRYDIVLNVPPESVDIVFGFLLLSTGKVWADDFKLEKVDSTVPLTSAGPALPRAPVNLDFEGVDSIQAAAWMPRKLHLALNYGNWPCGLLRDWVKSLLLQLGARPSDLDVSVRQCFPNGLEGVEATFWVLAPIDGDGKSAGGESFDARWEVVQIRLDRMPPEDTLTGSRLDPVVIPVVWQQLMVQVLKQRILPLFPVRSSEFDDHTSLRVQVLEPRQE